MVRCCRRSRQAKEDCTDTLHTFSCFRRTPGLFSFFDLTCLNAAFGPELTRNFPPRLRRADNETRFVDTISYMGTPRRAQGGHCGKYEIHGRFNCPRRYSELVSILVVRSFHIMIVYMSMYTHLHDFLFQSSQGDQPLISLRALASSTLLSQSVLAR